MRAPRHCYVWAMRSVYLVFSTSLSAASRSRVLARAGHAALQKAGVEAELIDVRTLGLPMCDGGAAYGHPAVGPLAEKIRTARGVLLCFPVYNYDCGAAAKNLIELTGKAWENQVVGLACAAGGSSSYMSPMGLANSLMLDFRCVIVPRFVYTTGAAFSGEQISDAEVARRVESLAAELARIGGRLRGGA